MAELIESRATEEIINGKFLLLCSENLSLI